MSNTLKCQIDQRELKSASHLIVKSDHDFMISNQKFSVIKNN